MPTCSCEDIEGNESALRIDAEGFGIDRLNVSVDIVHFSRDYVYNVIGRLRDRVGLSSLHGG